MKKIMNAFCTILTAGLIITACTKEYTISSTAPKDASSVEKANSCSCSASGFWSSCSITCPMKNGVCLANCTLASIGGIGILGSVATCTCGTVSVGKLVVGPEVTFDDVNVTNLEALKALLVDKQSPTIDVLKTALSNVLSITHHQDGEVRANAFNAFIRAMEHLTEEEVQLLAPSIQRLSAVCGR